MIRVFYGGDRVKAQAEIRRVLGEDYEVVEGEELDLAGLRDVMLGASLFGKRKIVIKELSANKDLFAEILNMLATEHEVVIWEEKIDKRAVAYKGLVKAGVEVKEFKLAEGANKKLAFDIYEIALRDGVKAVKMCEKIENDDDPYMFVGLMVSQAIRQYSFRYGAKERRALKELSRLDMQMKGESAISQPWTLVKSFLLRVSSL